MFEKATKRKFRFESSKGLLSTEDLWDLPLRTLDQIAIKLSRSCEQKSESFLSEKNAVDQQELDKLEIVKSIIKTKLAEKEALETQCIKKAKKEKILAILEAKKMEDLSSRSVEELQKALDELDD